MNAQDRLNRPIVFNNGLVSEEDYEKYLNYGDVAPDYTKLDCEESGVEWKVWSDRSRNPLYLKPNLNSPVIVKLDFNTEAYVIDVNSQGWIKIEIQDGSEGWVMGENLQLAPYALKKKGISRKAVVLANGSQDISVKQLKKNKELFDQLTAKYKFPNATEKNLTNYSKFFQILFIVKELDDYYLLTTSEQFKNGKAPLYAWMPKINITPWESRVCYAPNFGKDAFKDYPHDLPFVDNKDLLKNFNSKKPFDNNRIDNIKVETLEYGYNKPRWPNITEVKQLDSDVRQVQIVTGSSNDLSPDDFNRIMDELEKLRKSIKNVNLIFVIDATSSMSKYYPDIASAIEEIAIATKSWNDAITLKFVFTSYKDKADPKPIDWIEAEPFSSKFIDKVKNTNCSSIGADWYEEVYLGLESALLKTGVKKNENNFVILIGDDGNHPSETVSKKKVLQILKEYKAKLYVFQATTRVEDASMQFQLDAIHWIDELMKATNISGINFSNTKTRNQNGDLILSQSEFSVQKDDGSPVDYGRVYGKFVTNPGAPGGKTDPLTLKNQVVKDIDGWLKKVSGEIRNLELSGGSAGDGNLQDCVQSRIDRYDMSEELAEHICSRQDFSEKIYTPVRSRKVNSECLMPYVCLTKTEYEYLKSRMSKFRMAGTTSDKKNELYLMLKSMIAKAYGSDIDQLTEMEELTLSELWIDLFQVDFGMEAIRDVPLKDILSVNNPDAIKILQKSTKQFCNLSIKDYKWDALQDHDFYWIPANLFPGFN